MIAENSLGDPDLGVAAYDYVQHLNKADIAWEYLRRNPEYRRDWRHNRAGVAQAVAMKDGTRLFRPRRRFKQAEVWGLICFRCSPTYRATSGCVLVSEWMLQITGGLCAPMC